jgi:hypothetical protein
MRDSARRFIMRVYPRAWRERYGAEFDAMLEDSGAGWKQLPDVLKEGMTMRVSTSDLRIFLASVVTGLAIAGAIASRTPDHFRADAVTAVSASSGGKPHARQQIVEAVVRLQARSSLANLMQEPELDLYRAERKQEAIEDVIAKIRRDIQIRIDEIRLYPHAWRQRYGNEFSALLDDVGGGPTVFLNVLKGAISMRGQSKDFRYLAAFSVAGLLIAGGVSLRIPNRYRSSAVAEVRIASGADPVQAVLRATTGLLGRQAAIAKNIQVKRGANRPTPLLFR